MTPDEFWEMDEHEVVLVINGYQNRIYDYHEMLSHYAAAVINKDRKPSKQIKAHDLFNRKKLENKKRIREKERDPEKLKAERREIFRELKKVMPKAVPLRHRNKPPERTEKGSGSDNTNR